MLDLNADIISSGSSSSCDDNKALLIAKGREDDAGEQMEDEEHSAGTSDSSSVVNADEAPAIAGDENSSPAAAPASSSFVLDVFKMEKDGAGGGCSSSAEVFTRQLFPAPASGSPQDLGAAPLKAPRPQWLNLSFGGGDPLLSGETRSFQPQRQQQVRKSRRGPRSRSSQYRGVTFYRRTGRWESHIWDCGKQVYLGGFDTAYAAARAYDRAAIKFRGVDADINFNISDYDEDMKQMGNLTKEEFVQILRRQSTGFSRGSSKFRGMAALTKTGRWDTRVGQFMGKVPHDKVVIQYNSRETGTSLMHGAYDREIIMNVPGEGSGVQNLDLNLGMALPLSESKKVKVGTGKSYMNCIDCEAPGRELTLVNSTSVVSAPNKHLPSWPAMYPFLLPSSEGKAVEKRRIEAPANTNFGWQIPIDGNYGSGGTSAMPLMFSSNAASSGFSCNNSSSKPNSSSTHHQLHLIHKLPAAPQNPNPQLPINNNTTQAFPFFTFRS